VPNPIDRASAVPRRSDRMDAHDEDAHQRAVATPMPPSPSTTQGRRRPASGSGVELLNSPLPSWHVDEQALGRGPAPWPTLCSAHGAGVR